MSGSSPASVPQDQGRQAQRRRPVSPHRLGQPAVHLGNPPAPDPVDLTMRQLAVVLLAFVTLVILALLSGEAPPLASALVVLADFLLILLVLWR